MSSYALVANGIVVNIAEWDGVTQWNPSYVDNKVPFTGYVSSGWTFDGNSFIAPSKEFLSTFSHYEWNGEEWVAVMHENYLPVEEFDPEPEYEVE
jgi:hypothetical protein